MRKKDKKMRNFKKAVYLCAVIALLMAVGCSNADTDSGVSTLDTINFNDVINTESGDNNSNNQNTEENIDNQQDSDLLQQPNITQPQADSELDGSIESIDDNRVVVNQTFYPSENIAVSYEDSEKVLVTVYFSEETEFDVWTIKNGGVNGDADIEKRQGAFYDLNQGASVKMMGNYDGNDFHAKQVIIYNFV